MSPRGPSDYDQRIGERIRTRRKEVSLSQTALGEILGVSFQQVQKYEGGRNRIAASRIPALADALMVPLAYFFDEAGDKP
jgi:transcriptional regulator with XRE-family HTH domain